MPNEIHARHGGVVLKHLYVHIPFCRSRCAYCDFASEPLAPHEASERVDAYVAALRSELETYRPQLLEPLETIYVGGGTPTVLPREALLSLIDDLAGLQRPSAGAPRSGSESPHQPSPEFTVEANPGTIDHALLHDLRTAGVTRLSLGIQSFSSGLRANLGRVVTDDEVASALAALREVGWTEWNIDLVFGIPGQSYDQVSRDIDTAVVGAPSHISLYDLTYTSAYSSYVRHRVGEEGVSRALTFAEEHLGRAAGRLADAGYRRYEVSNFALSGHECRHNLAYWRGEDYVGIGSSAVSTIGRERRTNPGSVAAYLAGEPPEVEVLSDRTRLWETAMLGLRTADGVCEEEILPVLSPDGLRLLLEQGCLERHCGKLRLNPGFLDLSNSVLTTLLETPSDG